MANCTICARQLSFFETMRSPVVKRCNECNTRLSEAVTYWTSTIEQAYTAGGVSAQLEQTVYQNFQQLRLPDDMAQPVIQRLRYLRLLSEIQWGNIPIIRVNVHLDSDEYAHFSMPTTYHKPNKEVKLVPGQLIGTNKKMYFVSNTGRDSATIDWNNVLNVSIQAFDMQTRSPIIHIQVAKGAGGGSYSVADPHYTKIIIDTLVRLWKRQLVLYKEQNTRGAIPEHVKSAVFQRDQGRCVQCSYTGPYIEYDHIHPRSKGGQNTVENIQLLCRACNLKKSNRI
jgi:hypothetical protein